MRRIIESHIDQIRFPAGAKPVRTSPAAPVLFHLRFPLRFDLGRAPRPDSHHPWLHRSPFTKYFYGDPVYVLTRKPCIPPHPSSCFYFELSPPNSCLLTSCIHTLSIIPMDRFPGPSNESLEKALVEKTLWDLPLPAAVLDRNAIRRNCRQMINSAKALQVGFRAHIKTHEVGGRYCHPAS